jgi:hypothetical protein
MARSHPSRLDLILSARSHPQGGKPDKKYNPSLWFLEIHAETSSLRTLKIIGKFVILRYDKKFFTEYAKLTARKCSKSLK